MSDDLLAELLKAIHEDGGHYTAKAGREQSVQKAIEKFRAARGAEHALAIARNDMASLKIEMRDLREECDDAHRIVERQSQLLRDTANALHGGPLRDGWWSHHDLPKLAKALFDENLARAHK